MATGNIFDIFGAPITVPITLNSLASSMNVGRQSALINNSDAENNPSSSAGSDNEHAGVSGWLLEYKLTLGAVATGTPPPAVSRGPRGINLYLARCDLASTPHRDYGVGIADAGFTIPQHARPLDLGLGKWSEWTIPVDLNAAPGAVIQGSLKLPMFDTGPAFVLVVVQNTGAALASSGHWLRLISVHPQAQ